MTKELSIIDVNYERKCPNTLKLDITVKNGQIPKKVSYLAPQSPDYRQSYTGSAMPFSDAEIAFQNSNNKGSFVPTKNYFSINMNYPNSYYSHLGTRLIPPHVILTIEFGYKKYREIVKLDDTAPFRLLSYQSTPKPRISPIFYDRSKMKNNRTQEEILRQSGYKLSTPEDFWGGAVPHT